MIEIKNVSKWYGSFQVLTDCTTSVKKSEVVVVCGPSGSGKSTLIKTVNALEPFQKGEILVDGHNRYGICQQHGIAFETVQNTRFQSLQDVKLWMIDHHLGRRSLSDFQRGVLALRKKEITSARAMAAALAPNAPGQQPSKAELPPPERLNTRESIAKAARISSNTVMQIEKIQKTAVPELVAAVKAGTISINTAATVASMPAAEQVAAAAGGKSDLQQAAKRVRQGRAKPAASEAGPDASPDEAPEDVALRNRETQLLLLQSTVQQLTAERARWSSSSTSATTWAVQ